MQRKKNQNLGRDVQEGRGERRENRHIDKAVSYKYNEI